MQRVDYKKEWEINTKEDYENAMKTLDENEFIAEMSDDFRYWQSEKEEVRRQRYIVIKQAIEKGIISREEVEYKWRNLC